MPIDFTFRTIGPRNLDSSFKFIKEQDLGYPNYDRWTEKTKYEIMSGTKQGYALYYYGSITGDAIFQPHKQIEGLIEIKNVRIHPKLRQRRCASFMLKQIEFEMPWEAIIVDARASQIDIINLMVSQGYLPIAKTFIYDPHNQDIILIKLKNQNDRDRIIYNVKSTLNLPETPKNLDSL